MSDVLERYQKVRYDLPEKAHRWHLYGAGMDRLGDDGGPAEIALPEPGPEEILVRNDAMGICFSDIKIINLGPDHPRLQGRDLAKKPVVLGHEVSLTVVVVGENYRNRFKPGDRFIVQADVIYKGTPMAYGYMLPGALAQYGIIGKEIIEGDEGCYLLPVDPGLGYAEMALTEPWACVEASYHIEHRKSLKHGGTLWVIGAEGADWANLRLGEGMHEECHPLKVLLSDVQGAVRDALLEKARDLQVEIAVQDGVSGWTVEDVERIARELGGSRGIDDIILLGAGNADIVERASLFLAKGGIMNIVADSPMARKVSIDVGSVHYAAQAYIGSIGPDILSAYPKEQSSQIQAGGTSWFLGAGGPMGQMHVQRACQMDNGPSVVVATDIDNERLQHLENYFGKIGREKGRAYIGINSQELSPDAFKAKMLEITGGKGFDYIVVLAPVAALIEQAADFLAPDSIMNIFAGVPRGTMAKLDLSSAYMGKARYFGSSGSLLADLAAALHMVETGQISPNKSVAAICGLNAAKEGLIGVKESKFPGKVLIFPHIPDLPVITLGEMNDRLPEVAAHLAEDGSWTKAAEEALLTQHLRV
ncbi:MAG: zinc-binding dehydrogenase [Armatimonadetes bacterium]|nr:zinc-binding dehydrogenase [Armatimonadota bacterium]